MGFTALPWPQYGWIAAALALVTLMSIQGLGYLLPANLRVCLELQKDKPDNTRIARLPATIFSPWRCRARCRSSPSSSWRGWRHGKFSRIELAIAGRDPHGQRPQGQSRGHHRRRQGHRTGVCQAARRRWRACRHRRHGRRRRDRAAGRSRRAQRARGHVRRVERSLGRRDGESRCSKNSAAPTSW